MKYLSIPKRLLPCIFLTFISLLSLTHEIIAQQLLTYDSLYQPDAKAAGHAHFTYTLGKDKKVIKNGDFTFNREIKDTSCINVEIDNFWEGQYSNNLKEGSWEYKKSRHEVDIQGISLNDVQYTIESNIEILQANYKSGLFDDKFLYESVLYQDQERVKQLEYYETTFADTRINGNFILRLSDKDENICEIIGSASEGLMEGTWEFHYFKDKMKEVRVYEKGVLLKLAKISNLDTLVNIVFPLSEEIKQVLAGEETEFELVNKPLSLTFSDGYPRSSKYITEQQKGEEYLNVFLEKTFQYDTGIVSQHGLPIGTNRGYYTFTADEREYFEKWPETEYEYRQRIQKIKELETGNLVFKKDTTIQMINQWASRQDSIRKFIEPWNSILQKNQSEFYNRKGLLIDYAQRVLESDTIHLYDEEYVFEYETEEDADFLPYVVQNFETRIQVADSLIQLFNVQLIELNLANEVVALGETIMQKRDSLDSLYNIQIKNKAVYQLLNKAYAYYLENDFEDKYEHFLADSGSTPQLEQGQAILSQLNLLEEIYQEGKKISERNKMIDSAYTEYTFDPFTFSDRVPRRIKKRLYDIVTEEVIPELIQTSLKEDPKPAEVLTNIQHIQEVQERMVFLLDKDTQKLERKLRRNKSLDDRLELLKAS